ncbi:hypothetical protein Tco_0401338 [Tanacetum coccineum]
MDKDHPMLTTLAILLSVSTRKNTLASDACGDVSYGNCPKSNPKISNGHGVVLKNKALLVANGISPEDWIDFERIICLSCTIRVPSESSCQYAITKILIIYQRDNPTNLSYEEGLYVAKAGTKGVIVNDGQIPLLDTQLVDQLKLDEDSWGFPVDQTRFRGMVGALMYLYSQYLNENPLTSVSVVSDKDNDHVITAYAACEQSCRLQDSRRSSGNVLRSLEHRLYCDNKSAIALCCNNVQHSRSKHIDIPHHFIREKLENRVVELYFVETNYQLAGILTKALPRERFKFLLPRLRMKSLTPETLRRLQEGEDE